jgi:protein-L-isoaspartate O-methyltransferase
MRRLQLLPVLLACAVLGAAAGCTDDVKPAANAESGISSDSIPDVAATISTPQWVVDHMLEMADVSEDDVVYDLGSGDGRIVNTAAQRFGARGVGIERDPDLVRTARGKARLIGVSNRVTFRRGNLFEVDLHDATVVTLYLDQWINLKLRPKLLRQLDPGDRVVTHDFNMGDWTPTRADTIGDREVYLWVIPEQVPDSLLER